MTAPLKMPAPGRIPRDLSRLVSELARAEHGNADGDAEDDATQLWKPSDRSGVRWTSFETASPERFAFHAVGDEDDSTLISRPNLKDPRLLRSDRPPAALMESAVVAAPRVAPSDVTPPAAVVVPAPPPIPRDVLAAAAGSLPMDWDETPRFVIAAPSRRARPRARWAMAVGLAALGAVVLVVSDPERSATFVDAVVAKSSALLR